MTAHPASAWLYGVSCELHEHPMAREATIQAAWARVHKVLICAAAINQTLTASAARAVYTVPGQFQCSTRYAKGGGD
jgi:hypothetical protein